MARGDLQVGRPSNNDRDGGSLTEADGQRNRASVALGSPGECALRWASVHECPLTEARGKHEVTTRQRRACAVTRLGRFLLAGLRARGRHEQLTPLSSEEGKTGVVPSEGYRPIVSQAALPMVTQTALGVAAMPQMAVLVSSSQSIAEGGGTTGPPSRRRRCSRRELTCHL